MFASNVKLCPPAYVYVFTLGGLCRLVCVIAYGILYVCSACSPAQLMKCKQPKPRAAVTWSMLCCWDWERRRGEMLRGVCPFAFVCTCEPLGTACTVEFVWGWGAVQTEAGWWINHGATPSPTAALPKAKRKGQGERRGTCKRNVHSVVRNVK